MISLQGRAKEGGAEVRKCDKKDPEENRADRAMRILQTNVLR